MERRLQILIDEDRYSRLAREADATGRSVAAIIREAIDMRFPDDQEVRARAAASLLASAPDESPEPDWADVKADLESDIEARLP